MNKAHALSSLLTTQNRLADKRRVIRVGVFLGPPCGTKQWMQMFYLCGTALFRIVFLNDSLSIMVPRHHNMENNQLLFLLNNYIFRHEGTFVFLLYAVKGWTKAILTFIFY